MVRYGGYPFEEWKNHSSYAKCCVCKWNIEIGEPCVKVATIYFYHGCRSVYIHWKCIPDAIKALKRAQEGLKTKYFLWTVGGGRK